MQRKVLHTYTVQHLEANPYFILISRGIIVLQWYSVFKLHYYDLVPTFYLMDTGEQKYVTSALQGTFLSFHLKRATSVSSLFMAPGLMQRTNIWMDNLVPN